MRSWFLGVVAGVSILTATNIGQADGLGSVVKSVACQTSCSTGNLADFLYARSTMPGTRLAPTSEQKDWLETCLKCRNNVDNFMTNLKAFLDAKKDRLKINLICQTAEKLANDPKDYPNAEEIHQYYCGGRAKLQSTPSSTSYQKK